MDDYEVSAVKAPGRQKRPAGLVWNILTILVLLVTLSVAALFLSIYFNPNSFLNPFPPPITNQITVTASATTPSGITLVPSWTPTLANIQPSDTLSPTYTPLVPASPVEVPIIVPTFTLAPDSDYAFVVQQGSPTAVDGTQFHPDTGCNWSGIAGQAMSMNGEPVRGLFVELGGDLNGASQVDNLTMTGLAPQYGEGGFEITLANSPVASRGTLWIQLLDQQNLPLSDRVYFDTYDDCTKNLVIISFEQVH